MAFQTAGEDYLKAILMIQKEKGYVRSVDVAQYLSRSKPSVSHAVKLLREDGYLTMDQSHFIRLTDKGREAAQKVAERFQFFTEWLIDAGVEPDTAQQEACRMEHTISDEAFVQLKEKHKGGVSDGRKQE